MEVLHKGSCHCGKVSFQVYAPEVLECINCNCSICQKKQNIHFIVPASKFTLLSGEEFLTTYTFNLHLAKHTFCKICGVQSFYTPRSNQDGVGIMPHCLDQATIKKVNISNFDGQNWEDSMGSKQGETIRAYSKK